MSIKMSPRQIKTEANRNRLIEVSCELFDQYGYDHVTIDEICAAAQLSKGSFYHIFKAKEDLLMLSEKTQRSRYLEKHFVWADEAPLREQLLDFFACNFRYIQTVSRELARSTYISYIRTMRNYPVMNTYYHVALNGLITRGLSEGAFRKPWDSQTLYWMLHDWVIGLQIGWCIAPDDTDDERYFTFIEAFVDGLLA